MAARLGCKYTKKLPYNMYFGKSFRIIYEMIPIYKYCTVHEIIVPLHHGSTEFLYIAIERGLRDGSLSAIGIPDSGVPAGANGHPQQRCHRSGGSLTRVDHREYGESALWGCGSAR